MNRTNASVLLVLSIVVVLFALGVPLVSSSDWTTNRLGIAVLLGLTAISGSVHGLTLRVHYLLLPILPIAVIVAVYVLSYVVNPRASVVPVISWFLIFIVVVLLALILEGEDIDPGQLLEWLIVPTAAVTFVVPILVIAGTGSIPEFGFELRRLLDERSPVGLNRLVNGLTVLQLLCLIYAADGGVRRSSLLWLAIASGFAFLLVAFAGGSRQAVVGLAFAFGLLAAREVYFFVRDVRLRSVLIGVGAILGSMVVVGLVGADWFLERYYQVTVTELTRGSVRFEYYSRIVELIDRHWLLGVGPGQHVELAGNYPHNGYLGLLSEVGVVLSGVVGFALVAGTCGLALFSAASKDRTPLVSRAKTTLFIVVVTYFLIMVNLNDLLREYVGWVLVVLMVRAVSIERDVQGVTASPHRVVTGP